MFCVLCSSDSWIAFAAANRHVSKHFETKSKTVQRRDIESVLFVTRRDLTDLVHKFLVNLVMFTFDNQITGDGSIFFQSGVRCSQMRFKVPRKTRTVLPWRDAKKAQWPRPVQKQKNCQKDYKRLMLAVFSVNPCCILVHRCFRVHPVPFQIKCSWFVLVLSSWCTRTPDLLCAQDRSGVFSWCPLWTFQQQNCPNSENILHNTPFCKTKIPSGVPLGKSDSIREERGIMSDFPKHVGVLGEISRLNLSSWDSVQQLLDRITDQVPKHLHSAALPWMSKMAKKVMNSVFSFHFLTWTSPLSWGTREPRTVQFWTPTGQMGSKPECDDFD